MQFENQITICICDHQARDLLTCVDIAMVLSEGKVLREWTMSNVKNDERVIQAYFGGGVNIWILIKSYQLVI